VPVREMMLYILKCRKLGMKVMVHVSTAPKMIVHILQQTIAKLCTGILLASR